MMPTRIAGIPAKVNVTYYEPHCEGSFFEPPSGGEIEFNVYDRKGYRARWLEAKLTDADEEAIFDQYEAELRGQIDDARIEAHIDRMSA